MFARYRKCPKGGKHKITMRRYPLDLLGNSMADPKPVWSKHKIPTCDKCKKTFRNLWRNEHKRYARRGR